MKTLPNFLKEHSFFGENSAQGILRLQRRMDRLFDAMGAPVLCNKHRSAHTECTVCNSSYTIEEDEDRYVMSFPLPPGVKSDRIVAALENGMLTVAVQKPLQETAQEPKTVVLQAQEVPIGQGRSELWVEMARLRKEPNRMAPPKQDFS